MRKNKNDKILILMKKRNGLGSYNLRVIPENLIKKSEVTPDIMFALIKSKNINYLIEKVTEIGLKKSFN